MAAKPTLAQQVAALTEAVAALTTLVSAPVGAPAVVAASDHIGPSGKPDGRRFPCTAAKPCGRLLRSAGRAAIHGVAAGGHTAA